MAHHFTYARALPLYEMTQTPASPTRSKAASALVVDTEQHDAVEDIASEREQFDAHVRSEEARLTAFERCITLARAETHAIGLANSELIEKNHKALQNLAAERASLIDAVTHREQLLLTWEELGAA